MEIFRLLPEMFSLPPCCLRLCFGGGLPLVLLLVGLLSVSSMQLKEV